MTWRGGLLSGFHLPELETGRPGVLKPCKIEDGSRVQGELPRPSDEQVKKRKSSVNGNRRIVKMSSEDGTTSAPPFNTSGDHLTDGTIMPVGEEPRYRPGKGKVLLPSLAYHPSTSSNSENTESGSFEDEDEATALARFSPEQDDDEESDDDSTTFWPQTNVTAVGAIENVISEPKVGAHSSVLDCVQKSSSNQEQVMGWIYFSARFDLYRGHPDNNKEWKPRYFFVKAPHPTGLLHQWGVLRTWKPTKTPKMNRVQRKKYYKILAYQKFQTGGFLDTIFFTSDPILVRTDMGLTQEQEAAEVRAATRCRLEAMKERAAQASNKGKRPMKEGGRAPKRSKPSSASHRDMAKVSSIRRA
ncbi:hypothetical protein O6P43_013184 [Quillaja saponaria]|uniref:Uncharacterized protein n=1 Tax=Quillaja saponaria TaxID=32244 RepID=A0AAD7M370_QUISA|nr:hypothetical protein O6P43_013184 [Quillaja saponaria]